MGLEGLSNELLKPLEEQTKEQINLYIQEWSQKIYLWMSKAQNKIAQGKNMITKLEATKNANQNYAEFIEYYNVLNTESELIEEDIKSWLLNGYQLLNSIGEIVRGQQILYNVYTTSTGDSLVALPKGGKVYSWYLPFDVFLQITKAQSGGRLNLGSNRYVNKILFKLEEDKRYNVKKEEWSEDKIAAFKLFDAQARGVADHRWKNVNIGNTLEAFLRFGIGITHWAPYAEKDYWNSIAKIVQSAMSATMKQPDPFYQGSDLFDYQIKGLKASVTNFMTLINGFETTLNILRMNPEGFKILSSKIKEEVLPSVEKDVKDSQEKTVEKLKDYFSSKIDRSLTYQFNI